MTPLAALTLPAALALQDAPAHPVHEELLPIDIQLHEAGELWYEVRMRALSGETPAEDDPLAQAIVAMRALGELFDQESSWILVESFLLDTTLEEGFAGPMPGRLRVRNRREGVGPKMVAEAGLAVAVTLDAAIPWWKAEVWPERRAVLEEVRTDLRAKLSRDVQFSILTDYEAWVILGVREHPYPIRIVSRMPHRGSAMRSFRDTHVAFVGTADRSRGQIVESILHEVIHLHEVVPYWPPSAFKGMRLRMDMVKASDELTWDTVHLLHGFFAADMTRSHVDPDHVDNGVGDGAYEELGGLVDVVQPR